MKQIVIGADHAGYEHKEHVKRLLQKRGYKVEDVGSFAPESRDDYPLFAEKVARRVLATKGAGILVCGTGTGMAIAANKVPGIRAAFAYDEYSAKMARVDNDANVLTLRGREFPKRRVWRIVDAWLEAKPSKQPRHKRRIALIRKLERKYAR